jgi:endoglucanase
MDKIVGAATSRGAMVILDQHRPDQNGQSPLPYTSTLSEQQWIGDWVMLAKHYRSNPLVIGADLHNERMDQPPGIPATRKPTGGRWRRRPGTRPWRPTRTG